jgi:hypothetical protein
MKIRFVLGLLAPTALVAPSSFASDKAACLDASSKAQTFRDAHKLVEAREQLRICAAGGCPTAVRTDCIAWLAEVEQGLPTVVVSATDGAGHDRFDVTVTVDGQAPAITLQGQALPMNPGPHALHLEAPGAALDQQILVKEGVKNQGVAVILPRKKEDAASGAPAVTPAASVASPLEPARGESGESAPTDDRPSSGWRTAGWAVAGVGVVGVAVGAVFGFKAISDKNGAHCDAANACDAGPLSDANSAASIATVGVVAGGALLLGGAALVLFAPSPGSARDKAGDKAAAYTRAVASSRSTSGVTLKLAPLIGARAREGGLLLGGWW